MAKRTTTISHPIIASYVEEFIHDNEIEKPYSLDKHTVFEDYMNDLILSSYTNDQNASYKDMQTENAFGIDGVAIFVSDKLISNIKDFNSVTEGLRNFDVTFYFTQVKTTPKYERNCITDFLTGVFRFFNFGEEKCSIPELQEFWELARHIYSKGNKFKNQPKLELKFVCLSARKIDLSDQHLKEDIEIGIRKLVDLNLFHNSPNIEFLGITEIMELHAKNTTALEVTVSLTKSLIPYPKDQSNKIKSSYYGLIKLIEFIDILTDNNGIVRNLRKRIFNDNIRYYLGSDERLEVNSSMKEQLLDSNKRYLFGLLNNGITIICDEIKLISDELTLINFQVVNGCQTSNVIYECIEELNKKNNAEKEEIYLPIRLIATEDDETKNDIIIATNSQTPLRPEQLIALTPIQKAIEVFYNQKRDLNKFDLFYERRTEQYRDENIQKSKIINIPYQIKSASALCFDLPHEVSGQYGKVERNTKNLLFKENDLNYLNSYYVSGLAWYRVERFVTNSEMGKKYRRARWHIIMLLKYYLCDINNIELAINKKSEINSKVIERHLLDEDECHRILSALIEIINEYAIQHSNDRKLFERKETTQNLIQLVRESKIYNNN